MIDRRTLLLSPIFLGLAKGLPKEEGVINPPVVEEQLPIHKAEYFLYQYEKEFFSKTHEPEPVDLGLIGNHCLQSFLFPEFDFENNFEKIILEAIKSDITSGFYEILYNCRRTFSSEALSIPLAGTGMLAHKSKYFRCLMGFDGVKQSYRVTIDTMLDPI